MEPQSVVLLPRLIGAATTISSSRKLIRPGEQAIPVNTDNQTIALTGNDLSIANGNTIDLGPLVDDNDWAVSGADVVRANGNVGIGVSSPLAKLHVGDFGPAGSRNLMIGDDVYFSDIDVGNAIGLYGLGDSTEATLRLGAEGAEITGQNNRLGINTPTPTATLDVNGDVKVAGNTPIQFQRYSGLGDDINHNTGVSADDFTAAIVGFGAIGGDFDENPAASQLLIVYMYIDSTSNTWVVRADFRTENPNNEDWSVDVMFVRNEISSRTGY